MAWSIKYTLYRLLSDIKGASSFREVHEFYLYFVNHPSVVEALKNNGKIIFRASKGPISPQNDTRLYNCIYDPICLASMQLGMPYECKACGEAGKVDLTKWRESGELYRNVLTFLKEKRHMGYEDFRAVNEY